MTDPTFPTESKKRKYTVAITVKLPGNTKATTYDILTDAIGTIDAIANAQKEWRNATEPRDIHVKEIEDVITAS